MKEVISGIIDHFVCHKTRGKAIRGVLTVLALWLALAGLAIATKLTAIIIAIVLFLVLSFGLFVVASDL